MTENTITAFLDDREELIIIRQLPIIEQQLKELRITIEDKVAAALALEVTEATVKEVKAVRADLNKDFQMVEDRRKQVKKEVLAPYEAFENVYKENITDILKPADMALAEKIAEVENGLKEIKEAKVVEYFNEFSQSLGIDFVTFEQLGINVTLTKTEKSLKKHVAHSLDGIKKSLELIELEGDLKAEILAEYKTTLDLPQSLLAVKNRHKAIEAEKQKQEQLIKAQQAQKEAQEKVQQVIQENTLQPPKVSVEPKQEEPSKNYKVKFAVIGTLEQLKGLKNFLEDGGYKYEQQ